MINKSYLYELILLLKGINRNKYLKEIIKITDKKLVGILEWQKKQRDFILNHHLKNNSFYINQIIKKRIIKSFNDLPIIKKSDLQKFDSFFKINVLNTFSIHTGKTSGSSGIPLKFYKDNAAHSRTHAYIKKIYNNHNLNVSDLQARFYGMPISFKAKIKEQIKDFFANRIRFDISDCSDKNFSHFINLFKKHRFKYIYGYAQSIYRFSIFLNSKNIILKDICPSLKICILTGEKISENEINSVSINLGITVLNEYGVSEIDVLAFTNLKNQWELSLANVYFEVVDENDVVLPYGKVGRIIVTSLHNKISPIIRYDIGDIGSINYSDDKETLVLNKLNGRVSEIIKLENGKQIHSMHIYYILKAISSEIKIDRFLLIQSEINSFIFKYVSKEKVHDKDIKKIKKTLKKFIDYNIFVKVEQVDKIDDHSSGKQQHFLKQF